MARKQPAHIEPDTKDWTWVLERPCPDCGYDAGTVDLEDLPALFESDAQAWGFRLRRTDARKRPAPQVWAPVEYAAHVRDTHWLFRERVRQLLDLDDPVLLHCDHDQIALDDDYYGQVPATVGRDLLMAALSVGATYAGVHGEQWQRTGSHEYGGRVTVETLGLVHLHTIAHHAHDVGLGRLGPG